MKARWRGTDGQQAAMKKEILRQIREQEENYFMGLMAVFLWSMHINRGYGQKRLEEIFGEVWETYIGMRDFFDTDATFPLEYKLKQIGVDIDELKKKCEDIARNKK